MTIQEQSNRSLAITICAVIFSLLFVFIVFFVTAVCKLKHKYEIVGCKLKVKESFKISELARLKESRKIIIGSMSEI
jgi:hypothetical protein